MYINVLYVHMIIFIWICGHINVYIHTLSNFQTEPRSTWAALLSTWPRPSQHGSIGFRESSHSNQTWWLSTIPNMVEYGSPIEFQGRRCDPNSVCYKNYSQAWGYRMRLLSSIFSQNGLQQPWHRGNFPLLQNAPSFSTTAHIRTYPLLQNA